MRILSLGRNLLKKIEGLDAVADTLEELWLSYNQIERLSGVECCKKLKVLYASNNKIKAWDGVAALVCEFPFLFEMMGRLHSPQWHCPELPPNAGGCAAGGKSAGGKVHS